MYKYTVLTCLMFSAIMGFLFFYLFLKAGFHVAQATLLPLLHKCWDYWPDIQFYPLDNSTLCYLMFHPTVTVTES